MKSSVLLVISLAFVSIFIIVSFWHGDTRNVSSFTGSSERSDRDGVAADAVAVGPPRSMPSLMTGDVPRDVLTKSPFQSDHQSGNPRVLPTVNDVDPVADLAVFCTLQRAEDIMLEIRRRTAIVDPHNVSDIFTHLQYLMQALQSPCLAHARRVLKSAFLRHTSSLEEARGSSALQTIGDLRVPSGHRKLFFDLGSRLGDQTTMFLNHFPFAKSFEIYCFEASAKFNAWYDARPFLHFYQHAVGARNATLVLSDKSVGSSIVEGSGEGERVRVIDFPAFFVDTAIGTTSTTAAQSVSGALPELTTVAAAPQPRHRHRLGYALVKMDIEKMEYVVLRRMVHTGAILLLDDLLLECHYTTNSPRPSRPPRSIGKDDCFALVAAFQRALSTSIPLSSPLPTQSPSAESRSVPFECVLWNDRKTAKSSRYSERHGGFIPT